MPVISRLAPPDEAWFFLFTPYLCVLKQLKCHFFSRQHKANRQLWSRGLPRIACPAHCNYVIMGEMASQITRLTIVYSTIYSGVDHRKHQNSESLTFVRGIHWWPVNSPHKGLLTQKIFHLLTSSCHRVVLLATCMRKDFQTRRTWSLWKLAYITCTCTHFFWQNQRTQMISHLTHNQTSFVCRFVS